MKIASTLAIHHATTAATASPTAAATAAATGGPTDAVTLSTEAKRMLRAHDAERGLAPTDMTQELIPLEMYAVPGWFAEYGFAVPNRLGASANWFAESNPKAAAATQAERDEYTGLVRGHYSELMKKHGIADAPTHYAATIRDTASSEALHREFVALVRGDARLMTLLERMGKQAV